MTRIAAILCLALGLAPALVPAPAHAADTSLCGKAGPEHWDEVRDSFIGVWEMEHLAGYVVAASMTLPFPPAPGSDTVTIALFGDELVAVHPESPNDLHLTLADEPRWVTDSDNPRAPIVPVSPDDAAIIYGCEQMDMPRLLGKAIVVVDNVTMDFTYRMMALHQDQLYGIMEVTGAAHGYPFLARRMVFMNRLN